MALSITATEVPGAWAVRLKATGHTGTVSWFRDVNGRTTEVGDGPDIIDRLVPLNSTVYWSAIDDLSNMTTGPLTLASDHPVLSSSQSGAARQVVVVAQQPQSWAARSVWHPILDRAEGPIVSIFDAERRNGTMVLDLRDRGERDSLLGMLGNGDPLILRAVCPDVVDDLTLLPTSWSDPYRTEGQWSSGQRLQVQYQSVAAESPAWSPPASWTYQGVLDEHADYTEVLGSYRSYEALLAKVPG